MQCMLVNPYRFSAPVIMPSFSYPPVAFSSTAAVSYTATGGYPTKATGSYSIGYSSSIDLTTWAPWRAFDLNLASKGTSSTGGWATNGGYPSVGVYSGSTTTNSILGEWIELTFPALETFTLTGYTIAQAPVGWSCSAQTWTVLGTNGTGVSPTWTTIQTVSAVQTITRATPFQNTYSVSGSGSFNRYRIVFQTTGGGGFMMTQQISFLCN